MLESAYLLYFHPFIPMPNVETFFEILADSPLVGVYFLCAAFGGTLILFQMFLMMFGFGGGETDTDFGDTEHASTADIFKVLSFRTLTAGIAFFGLGGLAGWTGTKSLPISFIIAIISGLISIYAVYYLYQAVGKMKEDGSLSEKTLVGCTGSVYVRIPPAKSGNGKVLVSQQGRTVEYEAITAGEELKSGIPIVVVGVISTTTVEVAVPGDVKEKTQGKENPV
ncbi:MAG: hypothetical protein FWE95_08295 [Planctomycetaceae bacterium]|nr:hypothetical protein [Planctomycetaceae bacterium]